MQIKVIPVSFHDGGKAMILDKFTMIRPTVWSAFAVFCVIAVCTTVAWGSEVASRSAGSDTVVDTHLGPVSGKVSGDVRAY